MNAIRWHPRLPRVHSGLNAFCCVKKPSYTDYSTGHLPVDAIVMAVKSASVVRKTGNGTEFAAHRNSIQIVETHADMD